MSALGLFSATEVESVLKGLIEEFESRRDDRADAYDNAADIVREALKKAGGHEMIIILFVLTVVVAKVVLLLVSPDFKAKVAAQRAELQEQTRQAERRIEIAQLETLWLMDAVDHDR